MGGIVTYKRGNSTLSLQDFYFGSILGVGSFGKVREVRRYSDDRWFALKEFDLFLITSKNDAQMILNELECLQMINDHPFIMKLYASFRDIRSVYFMTELYHGGNIRLAYRVGEIFSEKKTAYVISCIGSALHYLHLHGIIHRDVKPENIVFNSAGVPKLIDFGISFHNPSPNRICVCQYRSGTKDYLAPEVFIPETHYHGYESDYWSLGVLMYEMLYKKRPYNGDSPLIPFVQYSKDTYQTAWESLLHLQGTQQMSPDMITTTSGHSINSVSNNTTTSFHNLKMNIDETRYLTQNYVDIGSFLINFDHSLPLSSDLLFPIPEINNANELTSKDCKDLLFGLLDVRLHLRLGVGNRSLKFSSHPWFLSHGYHTNLLSNLPSPIQPKLSEISDLIWNQYHRLNMFDILPSKLQTPELLTASAEIEAILNKTAYVSPTPKTIAIHK